MSRTLTRLLLSVAVLFGLLAVANPASADPDDDQGSVKGKVTDAATGSPIEGITVSIDGTMLEDVTDANGDYDIQNIPLTGDTATEDVVFEDENVLRNNELRAYKTKTVENVTITETEPANGVATVNTTLVRKAYIWGFVSDALEPGQPPLGCVEAFPVFAGTDASDYEAGNGMEVPNSVGTPAQVTPQATYVLADLPSIPLTVVFRDCDAAEGDQRRYRSEAWNNHPVGEDVSEQEVFDRLDYADIDLSHANVVKPQPGDSIAMHAQLSHNAGPSGSSCAVQPFPDVTASNMFCDDIAWMDELELAGGYADGQFKSANPISRQAMAAFLYRYKHAGADPAETDCETAPFDDVPATSPFCAHIEWLLDQDITTGFGDGDTFQPTAAVSRQAMAAFLYRLEHGGTNPVPTSCIAAPFSDVPSNHEFCAHIEWLDETGVTTGYADNTFRPGTAISRQAMAAFLHRLWNLPAMV